MEFKPIEILIVEDVEDDVIFLRRAFREARIRNSLHVVGTGREALDYLHNDGDFADEAAYPSPHLVILDLGLPDMTGLDLLRRIRSEERFAELPVLVLTISDHDEDIIRSYDLGVHAFIQKPVRVHNLQDFFFGDEKFAFVVTRA